MENHLRSIFALAAIIAPMAVAAPKPASAPAFDPVASFGRLVGAASAVKEWDAVQKYPRSEKWARRSVRITEPVYDVRKTDSLVHPVIGAVSFNAKIADSATHDSESGAASEVVANPKRVANYKVTGTYHIAGAAWKLHQLTYQSTDRDAIFYGRIFTITPESLASEKSAEVQSALQAWATPP